MNAGVSSGRQWFDGPGWIKGVHPYIQSIQFLQWEYVIPSAAQLEQTFPSVFIHLQREGMTWSAATITILQHTKLKHIL